MSVSLNSKDPELFSESFQTLIWLAVVFPKTDNEPLPTFKRFL